MTPMKNPRSTFQAGGIRCPRGFRPSDPLGVGLDLPDSVALLFNEGDLQKTR